MNERIQELATQADIWCDQNVAQGSPAYNNLWENKFAELIVLECASKVTRNEALNILEHFGVEE
jgi:hypothetical protein